MTLATGMAWLHFKHRYSEQFEVPVPDWVCTFDLPRRVRLIRVSITVGWRLPDRVLVADEFHRGKWSVWQ